MLMLMSHIKFAFDSFFSKNTREREREGKLMLFDLGTYIIILTNVYYVI